MMRFSVALHAGAAALALSCAFPAHAESGTVEFVFGGVRHNTTVMMGDVAVTANSGNGTLTSIKSSGAPFVEGESATVQCVTFAKKSPTAFDLEADCAATFRKDDSLYLVFKRKSGDLSAGTAGEGTEQITGGSGRFAGITGQCSYRVDNLADNWNVTMSKCEWKR